MVIVVGPRSGSRVTGVSVAIDTLREGLKEKSIPITDIDLSLGGAPARSGAFSFRRAASTLISLLKFYSVLRRSRVVYIPIAPTLLGFGRDALMIWGAWIAGCRIVVHLHGGGYRVFFDSLPWLLQLLVKATLDRANTIIVLGESLRYEFSFVDNPGARLEVVPNGLSIDFPCVRDTATRNRGKETIRILFLSNLIESKGYLDLLEACRLLRRQYQIPFQCTFCGEFVRTVVDRVAIPNISSAAQFHNLISSIGLEGFVSYFGPVRGESKWRILSASDLFVLPTYYPWEGQPISIIEALAFALPVISTRYRGIPEMVIDGYNGILIEKRSPQQIAEAIAALHRDSRRLAEYSVNSHLLYQKRFTREAHLGRLVPTILGEIRRPQTRLS